MSHTEGDPQRMAPPWRNGYADGYAGRPCDPSRWPDDPKGLARLYYRQGHEAGLGERTTAAALTARFRAAGINAEPGRGGSVVIYASDQEAAQILALLPASAVPASQEIQDNSAGQLAQAVAAALNTAISLHETGAGADNDNESLRAYATLITAMMGDSSFRNTEAVLMAITSGESEIGDGSLTQAAPDAVADAKRILFGRILARVPDMAERASAEDMLEDLLYLAEGSLDKAGRDELVSRILTGRRTEGARDAGMPGQLTQITAQWRERATLLARAPGETSTLAAELKGCADQVDTVTGEIAHAQPRPQPDLPPGITEYDVARPGCPVTVQAHSPEEAVALVVREQEQEEAEYGKYAGDQDPNPRYYVRETGQLHEWRPVYLDRLPELPPDDSNEE